MEEGGLSLLQSFVEAENVLSVSYLKQAGQEILDKCFEWLKNKYQSKEYPSACMHLSWGVLAANTDINPDGLYWYEFAQRHSPTYTSPDHSKGRKQRYRNKPKHVKR